MGNHLLGMSWVVRTKSGQVDEEASSKNILGHLVSEMAICTSMRTARVSTAKRTLLLSALVWRPWRPVQYVFLFVAVLLSKPRRH